MPERGRFLVVVGRRKNFQNKKKMPTKSTTNGNEWNGDVDRQEH